MNKVKYYTTTVLWNIISILTSGALLQTFLLEKGLTEDTVGYFFAAVQFLQIVIMLFFSGLMDRVRHVIRITALIHLLDLPLFVLLFAMCFTAGGDYTAPVFLCGLICNVAIGLYNILAYKLPYHIIDMKEYGHVLGVSSLLGSFFSLLVSLLLTFLQQAAGYFSAMKIVFATGFVAAALFAALTFSLRPVQSGIDRTEEKTKRINLLRYPPFTQLILPNLLRGFCLGMLSMAVTIGYFAGLLDKSGASVLLVITQAVSIAGSLLYTFLAGKERILLAVTGVCMAVFIPLMALFGPVPFLIFYGIAYFCLIIVNVAVPVAVTKIIDYEVAGQYNGWRMLLNTVGTFLASLVCVPLLRGVGTFVTLLITGLAQLAAGLLYAYCLRKRGL